MKIRQLHIEDGSRSITYTNFESDSNEDISIKGFGKDISIAPIKNKSKLNLSKLIAKIISYYENIMKIAKIIGVLFFLLLPK
ncbi:MAG: hypothetical protein WAO52_02840 [Prolixibacteraceae bacterium]